jgi:site-specific recombinase XerD
MHFRVKGKRSKIRFVPVNAAAQRMIEDYLALTGHRSDGADRPSLALLLVCLDWKSDSYDYRTQLPSIP